MDCGRQTSSVLQARLAYLASRWRKADLKCNLGGYVFKLKSPGTFLVYLAELTLSIYNRMDMYELPIKNYSCLS